MTSQRRSGSVSDTWTLGDKKPVGKDHLVHKVGLSVVPATDEDRRHAAKYLHRHAQDREIAEMLGVVVAYDDIIKQAA